MVTHLTTSPPVHCLSTAERTGSSIFSVLWSYVKDTTNNKLYNVCQNSSKHAKTITRREFTARIRSMQRYLMHQNKGMRAKHPGEGGCESATTGRRAPHDTSSNVTISRMQCAEISLAMDFCMLLLPIVRSSAPSYRPVAFCTRYRTNDYCACRQHEA